jgi:hypothetical protein
MYVCMYLYQCINVRMHLCMYVFVYVCICRNMFICMCVNMCLHLCMYVCKFIYIHTYLNTNINKYIHTYIILVITASRDSASSSTASRDSHCKQIYDAKLKQDQIESSVRALSCKIYTVESELYGTMQKQIFQTP